MLEVLIPLASAIFASIIYGLGGYLNRPEKEEFDDEKLAITVIIGAAVGVISFYTGESFDIATQLLSSAGLVVLIEKYGKAVIRKIRKWWNK